MAKMKAADRARLDALVGRRMRRNRLEHHGVYRIIAHAEGYLMFRHTGCAPTCRWWRDVERDYTFTPNAPANVPGRKD